MTKYCRPLTVHSTVIRSLRDSARNTYCLSSSLFLAFSLTSIFFFGSHPVTVNVRHPPTRFVLLFSTHNPWPPFGIQSFRHYCHPFCCFWAHPITCSFSFHLSISADYTFISSTSDSLPAHYEFRLSSTLCLVEGVILFRLSLAPSLLSSLSPSCSPCLFRLDKNPAFVDISTTWLFPPNILLHGTSCVRRASYLEPRSFSSGLRPGFRASSHSCVREPQSMPLQS